MAEQLMLQRVRRENPSLTIYSVNDPQFREYGRVIERDAQDLIAAAQALAMPSSGAAYTASESSLEQTDTARFIQDELFGQLDTQVGCCLGYGNRLNALEWHTSSEVNIAVTPLLLLLGRRQDVGDEYDSKNVVGFFVDAGQMIEVYATTLHFCPCQLLDDGFCCVVALPRGTNTPSAAAAADPRLTRRNKWLIRCGEGIIGENYTVNY